VNVPVFGSWATALTGVGFASHPDGVPTGFTVQTWDGAHWADQVHITGNTAVHRWIRPR